MNNAICTRRGFLKAAGMMAAALQLPRAIGARASAAPKPNFIIIFTDDQGYEDVGCFGSKKIRTPRLDKMASEGMKFTSFYAQTVCGPSRASLTTHWKYGRLEAKGASSTSLMPNTGFQTISRTLIGTGPPDLRWKQLIVCTPIAIRSCMRGGSGMVAS